MTDTEVNVTCQDGHVSGVVEALTGKRRWVECGRPAIGYTVHQGGKRRHLCRVCVGFHPGETIHPLNPPRSAEF